MRWWSGLVLAGLACGGPQTTVVNYKPEPLDEYAVYITNEATVAARVEDSYGGKAKRVYGGLEMRLGLQGDRSRFLIVEVGSHVFRTEYFNPNSTAPCWKLIVKQPPRRPDGPWPMLKGCPD